MQKKIPKKKLPTRFVSRRFFYFYEIIITIKINNRKIYLMDGNSRALFDYKCTTQKQNGYKSSEILLEIVICSRTISCSANTNYMQ